MSDRILEVASVVLLVVIGFFLALAGVFSPRARYSLEAKVAAFDRAFVEVVK